MNFNQALTEIKKEYSTITQAPQIEMIAINKLLDPFNTYFVVLKERNGKAILSDLAKTCDIIELEEEEYVEICKKYNLNFSNWDINCEFTSNDTLRNFISFLDEIAK